MELNELLRIIGRRWRFVVAAVVVALVAAGVLTQLATPTYGSQARLYLSSAQTTTSTDAYQLGVYAQQRLASYAELATDPTVLRGTIRRASVTMTPRELGEKVSASAVPNTVILQIDVQDSSARTAQELANAEAEEVIALIAELESPEVDNGTERPEDVAGPPIVARIAGEATLDFNPVAPNLPLNLVLGLLAGLVIGLVGAAVRDRLDSSITSADELAEATDLPLLASVPFDADLPEHPLISDPASRRDLVEVYRILRSKLQFATIDAGQDVVMVTSALPEEGKSVTAVNLAISMAQRGRRVLLLDADLRKPTAGRLLGLDNSVGLISVLLGRSDLEHGVQAHGSGVDFLGTGPLPPNPAEVIETQAMSDLVQSLRASYDVVVVDAPPLLPVADPALLALLADQVLVVTRHGRTSRKLLASALDRLPTAGPRVVGVVLTMVPTRRGRAAVGQGFEYGYGEMLDAPIPVDGSSPGDKRSRSGSRRA